MAKKKTPPTPPKPEQFRTTPFSALKGLAVAQPAAPTPPKAAEPPPPKPVVDDSNLFLQAMQDVARLNTPRPAAARTAPLQTAAATRTSSTSRSRELDPTEREAFAQAIGQLKLDVTFTDSVPEEDELKPLGANRLRQLKRGVISVDRQLDLHGLCREEALEALPGFLTSARNHGVAAVLIITGKGNNSPGEPVLQQAVAGWLRDAGRSLVVEYAPAPREMGGSGAFIVFLRPKEVRHD